MNSDAQLLWDMAQSGVTLKAFIKDQVLSIVNNLFVGYKERLALIPKLLISATGDEFFLLTDTLTWWDDFYGDKWIM